GQNGAMRRVTLLTAALVALAGCGADPVAQPAESAPTSTRPNTRAAKPAIATTTSTNSITTTPDTLAATVTEPAERRVHYDPDAVCDLAAVEALAGRHPDVRQFVVMATESFGATWGTVEVAVRDAGVWRCQTNPLEARFGRNGTRPL